MENLGTLAKNIRALYSNEDIFVEASVSAGRNVAVEEDGRMRVIRLIDSEIMTEEGRIYRIHGTAFLTPYLECEKQIKTRKRTFFVIDSHGQTNDEIRINLYPTLVDHLWSGGDIDGFVRKYLPSGSNRLRVYSANLEEIRNFACMTYKEGGVVVLSKINPVKPIINRLEEEFEGNNMHYGGDYFLDSLNLPIGIKAREAEFTFESENFLKVSDGKTDNIGRYKNGMLTLENAQFIINGIDDKINFSHHPRIKKELIKGLLKTGIFGWFIGGGFGVLISFGGAIITDPDESFYSIVNIGSPLLFCALGLSVAWNFSDQRKVRNCVHEIQGDAYLKAGFFGNLKDYRSNRGIGS